MNHIETMKMALEWYDSGQENRDEFIGMIKSITAIAQGESEPVGYLLRGTWDFVPGQEPPDDVCDAVYMAPVADYVPLTMEQIIDILGDEMDSSDDAFVNFARAIERAVRGVK